MINCEQVRELEGAFALGALDASERAQVVAHLEICGEHRNIAELRAAGILVGAGVEEHQPSERLRARVLASAATGTSIAPKRSRLTSIHRWWYAAAASMVLLLAGAGVMVATRDSNSSDDGVFVKEFVAANVAVHFEANFDNTYSRATFAGLVPTEDYHLWVIRGDDWLSVGTFRANPEGKWAGDFVFQTKQGDALCLTVGNPTPPATPFGQPLFVEPVS